MALRLGMDGWIGYNTAWAGTYSELGNVKDVNFSLETAEADVTTRSNSGWRATVGTLKEASVEFEMVWDTADAGFAAVKDAWFDNSTLYLQVLDAQNGSGLKAAFSITTFSRSESLEEAMMVSVTAKVTYDGTNAPEWQSGSGSQYTAGNSSSGS
tara:strand:+ start:457 stop:921 length:465 start_codon:yes stop_codon:yes gene_type:complete